MLGAVERIDRDPATGALVAVLVRQGRSEYLLRVPGRFVAAILPERVCLTERFADVQTAALLNEDGDVDDFAHVEVTEKTPHPSEVLGITNRFPAGRSGG